MSSTNSQINENELCNLLKELASANYSHMGVDWVDEIQSRIDKLFKKSRHSMSNEGGKDWEIQCLVVDTRLFWLQKSGLYKNELFGEEHTAENIMKWPSFKHIHSVKRLSDSTVFSIGNELDKGRLEKIPMSTFGNPIFQCNGNVFHIDQIQKATIATKPVPLFTTEDGKEVFKGDEYFAINYKDFIGRPVSYYAFYPHTNMPNLKYFSTEQAANEYIIMNKRCLSVIDTWGYFYRYIHPADKISVLERLKQLAQSKINTP